MRAFRAFDNVRGDSVRPWLLAIVRNCWRTRARVTAQRRTASLDDEKADEIASAEAGPETAAIQSSEARRLNLIMGLLPDDFRAVLVLREMEDLSYQEIAETLDVPIGTVMSRLARARAMLREKWLAGGHRWTALNCSAPKPSSTASWTAPPRPMPSAISPLAPTARPLSPTPPPAPT